MYKPTYKPKPNYNIPYDIPDNKPDEEYVQRITAKALSGKYYYIKEELLKSNGNLLFQDEKTKKTIIHIILENSVLLNSEKYKLIKLLFIHGAPIDYPDANNIRPLHLACKQQNEKLIKLLCKKGADVNSRDINFQTPLHYAVLPEFTKCPEKRKINKDDDQNNRMTLISELIYEGLVETIKKNLLKNHYDIIYDIYNKYPIDDIKLSKFNEFKLESLKNNNPQLYKQKLNSFVNEKFNELNSKIPNISSTIDIEDGKFIVDIENDRKQIVENMSRFDNKFDVLFGTINDIYKNMGDYQRTNYGFMYFLDKIGNPTTLIDFNPCMGDVRKIRYDDDTDPDTEKEQYDAGNTKTGVDFGTIIHRQYTFNTNISHEIVYPPVLVPPPVLVHPLDNPYNNTPIVSNSNRFFTQNGYGEKIIHYLLLIYQYNDSIKTIYTEIKTLINTSLNNLDELDIKYIVYKLVDIRRHIVEMCLILYNLDDLHKKYLKIFNTRFAAINERIKNNDIEGDNVRICKYKNNTKNDNDGLESIGSGKIILHMNGAMNWQVIYGEDTNEKTKCIYFAKYIRSHNNITNPQKTQIKNILNRIKNNTNTVKYIKRTSVNGVPNVTVYYYVEKEFKLKPTPDATIKYIQDEFTKLMNEMYTEIKKLNDSVGDFIDKINIVSGLNYIKSYNSKDGSLIDNGTAYDDIVMTDNKNVPYYFTNFKLSKLELPPTFTEYLGWYGDTDNKNYDDVLSFADDKFVDKHNLFDKATDKKTIIHNSITIVDAVEKSVINKDGTEGKYAENKQINIKDSINEHSIIYADSVLNYFFKFFKLLGIKYISSIYNTDNIKEELEKYKIDVMVVKNKIVNENIDTIFNSMITNIIKLAIKNKIDNNKIKLTDNSYKNLLDKTVRDAKESISEKILIELNKDFVDIGNQGLQYLLDPFGPPDNNNEETRLIPFDKFDIDIGTGEDECSMSNPVIIPELIKHGANPNSIEKSGETALTLAIYRQYKDVVKTLLESGSNVVYKINNILKNTYESCLYQLCTIIEGSPMNSLDEIDERCKRDIEKLGNMKEHFYYSRYILKMAMYLFNHQLTQHSDNYPYMWNYNEHKALTELLNIESKNIELPFGRVDNRFKVMLKENSFVKDKVVEKYNVKIHKYTELKLRFENAKRNLEEEEKNVSDGILDAIHSSIKKLDRNIERVGNRIDKYKNSIHNLVTVGNYSDTTCNNAIVNKYNKKPEYRNSICNYYEDFFKKLLSNDGKDKEYKSKYTKNISEHQLYTEAWKNILDRQESDIVDYTQLVSILNRYISEHESMKQEIFTEIYRPVVSFYDKVLDKYGRDYFELSEYYNTGQYMKDTYDGKTYNDYSYGHNYALTQMMCIMIHVVKHTMCLDFVRTVSNKIIKALLNKGKTTIVTQLHNKLKDFYKQSFDYIPEKMVKTVCRIYESDYDPDNKLTEKDILNTVFGYINKEGNELVINELDLNNIKGEVIRQFEDYMKTYILEMHKMFVLQLKSFSVHSRLLKITMMLAEKAKVEMEEHKFIK